MKRAQNAYQTTNTLGMSQLDLIIQVYRGAIGFMRTAKTSFQENHFTEGRTACEKARKCVVHLYTTLDMDKGREIAENLSRLYAYAIKQIDLVEASKSMDQIDDVINVLTTLKEGWEALKHQEGYDVTPAYKTATEFADKDGETEVATIGAGELTISA